MIELNLIELNTESSNVLFIVASLVKEIKRRVLDKDSNFKQLFVLTHNVYFFRQVTFCGSKDQKEKNKNTFWIIRKKDVSTATQYNENPIKTSYQLLWHELRVEKDHNALITSSVCNTMRRILENYFKYMGGINNEKLIESFSNEEKHICNSLLAFVNAGSHCMDDDEFFTSYDETISKYLDVFKRIFENSGHIAHYNMMMEIEN